MAVNHPLMHHNPIVMLRLPTKEQPLQHAFTSNHYQLQKTKTFGQRNSLNDPEFEANTTIITLAYTGDDLIRDTTKASQTLEADLHAFLPALNLFAHITPRGLKSLTSASGNPQATPRVNLRVPHTNDADRRSIPKLLKTHGFKIEQLAAYDNNGNPTWTINTTFTGVNLTQAATQLASTIKRPVLLRIPHVQLRTTIKPPAPTRATEPPNLQTATT